MKIGLISNLYPPFVRGGAEIIATMVAEGMKKAWQHVFVISTKPHNVKVQGKTGVFTSTKFVVHGEVNEVPVYRFTPINIYYYLNDFRYPSFIRLFWHLIDMFNIFSYFTVKKILQKEKPEIVITHNLMGVGFLLPRLFKKLKIKHVHTLHDVQLVTPSGLIIKDKEKAWQHKFFRMIGYVKIMRWLMGSPEIVISPSKFLLDFYQRSNFFPNSKKTVIPNPTKGAINIRKVNSHKMELLYLGQVHQAKGVLDLINNFKKLKLPHLRLNIVGIGSDLVKAKQLAKKDKRIVFHGWLPNNRLWPLLAKMDVLIVPSLCYENSPTVIYEALSMGLPVIAADIGGVAELIQEGVNGWVFPAGDFNALNKKIAGLYRQREKLPLMARNCQQSMAKYNIDNYTNQVLKLIDEVR